MIHISLPDITFVKNGPAFQDLNDIVEMFYVILHFFAKYLGLIIRYLKNIENEIKAR